MLIHAQPNRISRKHLSTHSHPSWNVPFGNRKGPRLSTLRFPTLRLGVCSKGGVPVEKGLNDCVLNSINLYLSSYPKWRPHVYLFTKDKPWTARDIRGGSRTFATAPATIRVDKSTKYGSHWPGDIFGAREAQFSWPVTLWSQTALW